jgi:hypothetical protein
MAVKGKALTILPSPTWEELLAPPASDAVRTARFAEPGGSTPVADPSQLVHEIEGLINNVMARASRQLSPKQRLGRPLKRPAAGRRFSLGLKVTAATKTRLDNAARASGRTQSQEAEVRIERSFDRQDLLPEVLSLAYGKRAASLLMRLGPLISDRTLGAEHAGS